MATLHFKYLEPGRSIFKKTKLDETEKEEKEIIGNSKEKSKELTFVNKTKENADNKC